MVDGTVMPWSLLVHASKLDMMVATHGSVICIERDMFEEVVHSRGGLSREQVKLARLR